VGVVVSAGHVSRVRTDEISRHDAGHLKFARQDAEMRLRRPGHRDDADCAHAQRRREKGGRAALNQKDVLLEFAALNQTQNGFRIREELDHP
jgi:hypothetical protein